MREKILNAAAEMFLTYGFKSVTMDDIAHKIGVSKKTIYANYSTKTKLVQATGNHLLNTISKGIEDIRNQELDPVIENFEIKRFVNQHLKGEKTSPHFQLKKYYPKIYENLHNSQFKVLQDCVSENIRRGIELGYYRKDLNLQFITRIHFIGMLGIKDKDIFPIEEYDEAALMSEFLEYHLRAICTEKGLKILDDYIHKNEK
ncbi:TetR family transcriptional regulator [Christiangramia fulva]|uniref:TetR family transcriptional regulator n=1 Tax=Christiangramia fulva TaxID=2126553 RepID=A0A2R3ZAR2_9FLAO|nr:TetR/AcrR family transcriptional regulator [Christiangramia fulva]AVR47359.1 TetR family transcriptional regulator [Christiangramia fulva]